MTVRTLSGATVTLVGRGANYFDGDAIIPSFVDADGTEYFLTVNAVRPEGELPAICDGLLVVGGADSVLPFEPDTSQLILVNNPSSEYNSTSALVFAKRCGIDVSLEGLQIVIFSGQSRYLADTPLTCENGVLAFQDLESEKYYAYVDDGWGDGSNGMIGCSFEPNSDAVVPSDSQFEAEGLNNQSSPTSTERRYAHNAWVCILAGVPESVFD